jgi:DNA-binding transcriptional ArsR family regulator
MKNTVSGRSLLTTELQSFLKAVASETRQQILLIFATEQPLTVGEISKRLDLSISTTSEQLAILKSAKMVTSERDGKEVMYQVDRESIFRGMEALGKLMQHCCKK